jgi:hypothetical protein
MDSGDVLKSRKAASPREASHKGHWRPRSCFVTTPSLPKIPITAPRKFVFPIPSTPYSQKAATAGRPYSTLAIEKENLCLIKLALHALSAKPSTTPTKLRSTIALKNSSSTMNASIIVPSTA